MSRKCKCNIQAFDTLQFFEENHHVVYCTKCKKPKRNKIDLKSRMVNKQKISKTIQKIESQIQKTSQSLRTDFNKGPKFTINKLNSSQMLKNQIDELMYYKQF